MAGGAPGMTGPMAPMSGGWQAAAACSRRPRTLESGSGQSWTLDPETSWVAGQTVQKITPSRAMAKVDGVPRLSS